MILVTGGAGYIGSHCVLDLIKSGCDVVILDNLSSGHEQVVDELKKQKCEGKIVDFVKADLRDVEQVFEVFKAHKIDSVIHFGALALVGESVENPQKYYRNNVVGSLNLLDAMLKYNVKNIVFSSTCATYGEPKHFPIDETHPQSPINPYGNTKLAIEYAIKDYSKAYGINYVIFRYFNVYGANKESITGEWHDIETHLVPNIIKSTLSGGKTFELYGEDYKTPDGTCIRDYINVEELAVAHRLAYQYLKENSISQIFNLGTENGQSVKDIFGACEKVLGKKIPLKVRPRRDGDPARLIADATRVKEILKWCAQESIENSIKSAYEWEIKLEEIKEEIKK